MKANPRLTMELDRLRVRTPRHSGLRPRPQHSSWMPGPISVRLCRQPGYFAGGRNGLSAHLRTAGSCSGSSSQLVQT